MPHDQDVIGWLLGEQDRADLLKRVPPRYGRVVAQHVTLKQGAGPTDRAWLVTNAQVVGVADDEEGVQALVVSLEGTTDRSDGGTYHITWSLGPGRDPIESNRVIADRGWTALDPVSIALAPGRF